MNNDTQELTPSQLYYKKNKARLNARRKELYYACEERRRKVQERNKAWSKDNYNKIKAAGKLWRDKHREHVNALNRARLARYNKENPNYKIATRARNQLYFALVCQTIPKTTNAVELLGADIETVRRHLESQFLEGMSWSNHGSRGWHIDHIKPINTFDLSDPKQLHECFHYTNLRPLWWKDNLGRPKNGSDLL
jgi:hypothetical protein